MSFRVDEVGRLLPPGLVHKTKCWEVWNDAGAVIPASGASDWLTSDQGVVSFPTPVSAAGQGVCRVTTGAVAGNKANVKANFQVDFTVVAAVILSIEGLNFDAATGVDVELSLFGAAGVGVGMKETGAATNATLYANGTTDGIALIYAMRDLGRKNLMLAASPQSRHVAAFQGTTDFPQRFDELGYREMPSLALGNVTAKLEITTQTAAARYFQFGRIKLEVWY